MKRKELYNYIRQEIINELTIVTKNTSSDEIPNIAKAEKTDVISVKKAVDAAKASGKDVNIAELARQRATITVGDPEKLQLAKEIYEGSNIERIIDAVMNAGEAGITQEEISEMLGISFNLLTQSINDLTKIGAFSKPKKTADVEPTSEPSISKDEEEVEKDEWEMADEEKSEEEVEKDEWETAGDEEESPKEEEPQAADITAADKEAEKVVGGKSYAQKLSPEDEEKYIKLKKGIESKVTKLMDMPKAKRETSDDIKILKQLINRDDVKKLFKAKGVNLKDLTSDIF